MCARVKTRGRCTNQSAPGIYIYIYIYMREALCCVGRKMIHIFINIYIYTNIILTKLKPSKYIQMSSKEQALCILCPKHDGHTLANNGKHEIWLKRFNMDRNFLSGLHYIISLKFLLSLLLPLSPLLLFILLLLASI